MGWIRVGLVAALSGFGAVAWLPAAGAIPGDPMAGCETGFWGNQWCDGPIREDGTWQRCATWHAQYAPGPYGGGYTPGGSRCEINGGDPAVFMPGSPDHHID